MELGKRRRERQPEAFAVASDLPKSPGHPFYTALNRLLEGSGFDPLLEKLCAPYYTETTGRSGVPPGVLFRMLFVGYFKGLKSHRSISWRCTDSRSLGDFLGLGPSDPVPNHFYVSKTHKPLPEEVFNEGFRFILSVAAHKGLLWGKAIGIDSTTIQANASMARKVRKESGEGGRTTRRSSRSRRASKIRQTTSLANSTGITLEKNPPTTTGKTRMSRRHDHANEGWNDANGLQDRACRRYRHRHRGRGDLASRQRSRHAEDHRYGHQCESERGAGRIGRRSTGDRRRQGLHSTMALPLTADLRMRA
jgi:hypothetical protein